MRNKKLVIVNSLSNGGAEKVTSLLVDYYDKNNVDFDILLLNDSINYPISESVEKRILRFPRTPFFVFKLAIFLLKSRYTSIQSHLFYSNYLNAFLKIIGFKHKAILVHCVSFTSKFKGSPLKYFGHRLLMKCLYRRGDIHIFKSKGMALDYLNYFKPKSYQVIHNPILNNITVKPKDTSSVYPFKIAVVSRFHATKRHRDLIDISLSLPFAHQFHLYGGGEGQSDFSKLVINNGLEENFIFHGRVDNVIEELKSNSLYISCSEAEGFPNALIEAMAVGLPVIHSDCRDGPREILMDHFDNYSMIIPKTKCFFADYGVMCEVGDIIAFKEALITVHSDAVLLNRLSELARSRYKYYSNFSVYEKYLSTLK